MPIFFQLTCIIFMTVHYLPFRESRDKAKSTYGQEYLAIFTWIGYQTYTKTEAVAVTDIWSREF